MTWTIPSTADLRSFLQDLEPIAAALLAVSVAAVIMLLVGLMLLVRGRRRRKVAARAARAAKAAAAAARRRDPVIRRSTPSPLFAGRGDQADVLASGLEGTTDALGVLRALEAADRAEPIEPGPPLPRWLDPEPEPAPQVETVVESVVESVLAAEPVGEHPAPPSLPALPAPPVPTFVRSVDTRAARRPRPGRVRLEPWMVVAGAVLFLAGRRGRPRGPIA